MYDGRMDDGPMKNGWMHERMDRWMKEWMEVGQRWMDRPMMDA